MRGKYIKVIGFFIITFFFLSISHSYAEESMVDFPKNEKTYNIDRMNNYSLKELEGKLITSDDGKVVRLVDADHNGKVLVNEGVIPEAVTVFNSIEDAVKVPMKAAAKTCSNPEYIKFLKKRGIPSSVVIKNKTYKLNADYTREYKVIVYGKPSNISNNSYKKGEYEFLGFGQKGGWVMNHKYPVQALGDNGPAPSNFLTPDEFTGAAEDAGELQNVYVGGDSYSAAKSTIEMFKTKWKWKLTDKKAASWWLSDSSPKIKMQGLYTEWFAGLGVTQYKSATTGKNWYQTYMVKPDIPTECIDDDKNDVKAVKLKGIYKGGKVIADFTIQNNDPEKESVTTPKNIPWSIEWSYTGYDSKGKIITKSGSTSNTKSYFPTKLAYQSNKTESYTINTGIQSSWGGTVTLKAKWNPSCSSGSSFEETNCNNNTATTTVTFEPSSGGGATCDPDPLEYNYEYEYEYDLSLDKVQAYTAEAGTQTRVITTVSRADFSSKWKPVLERLKAKYQAAMAETKRKEKALDDAAKKSQDDQAAYSRTPSTIESCEGTGKEKVCSNVPNPEKARLAALVEADEIAYQKAFCDWIIAGDYETKASTEYGVLYWDVGNYKELRTLISVYHENQPYPNQTTVMLEEGESYVFDLDDFDADEADSIIRAEVNPLYESYSKPGEMTRWHENEVTFDNNVLETPLYVSSHEQACAPPGEDITMEGVVRTTTTPEGTKEDKEVLSGKVIEQSTSKIKAGYGFSFLNNTKYTNPIATSEVAGIETMDSRFDTLPDHLEYEVVDGLYKVPNEKKSTTNTKTTATAVWQLPHIYVEKFSGNLFDEKYASNPNRNRNDTIIDGGRKWYVDFNETDRFYPFVSYSGETGVNKMTLCLMGEVEVKGAILKNEVTNESDETKEGDGGFILRTIQPDNPFPGGVGWNWAGKTSSISSLNSWWNGSSSSYSNEFLLTPSKVNALRNYNRSNEIKDVKPNTNFHSIMGQ